MKGMNMESMIIKYVPLVWLVTFVVWFGCVQSKTGRERRAEEAIKAEESIHREAANACWEELHGKPKPDDEWMQKVIMDAEGGSNGDYLIMERSSGVFKIEDIRRVRQKWEWQGGCPVFKGEGK